MLLVRKNIDELVALQSKLSDNFDMKDLGDANHILDMQILRDKDKRLLYLSQTEYINKAKNPVFYAKTKHISVKYHFIQDVLENKHMQLVKVHTDDNSADLLTKGLPSERFTHCRTLMGIR
ncbi:hypothetical protein L7F22_040766 [Adiantum nelumboides]|nr:hypothetical protein [Adiantum nelumboides]